MQVKMEEAWRCVVYCGASNSTRKRPAHENIQSPPNLDDHNTGHRSCVCRFAHRPFPTRARVNLESRRPCLGCVLLVHRDSTAPPRPSWMLPVVVRKAGFILATNWLSVCRYRSLLESNGTYASSLSWIELCLLSRAARCSAVTMINSAALIGDSDGCRPTGSMNPRAAAVPNTSQLRTNHEATPG